MIYLLEDKKASKVDKLFITALLVSFATVISIIFVGSNIAQAHSLPVTEIPAANSIVQKGALSNN